MLFAALCLRSRLVFPFYSFLSPAPPFPTHWLPRVGSPLFWRYYEDAKTSGCSSPRSSFPSSDGYLLDSISFARLGLLELLPRRLGVGLPVSPPCSGSFSFGGSQSVLSSSQGTLSCFCPALGPRSDLRAKPFRRFNSAPAVQTTKAPTLSIVSRLYHTAFAPLHTLRAAIADDYAMFASGWWPTFAGWASRPLGPCFVFPSLAFVSITCSSSHSGFT